MAIEVAKYKVTVVRIEQNRQTNKLLRIEQNRQTNKRTGTN